MGTEQVRHLRDVSQGTPPSRLRLLAPLRYLAIRHQEKTKYDFYYPVVLALASWALCGVLGPHVTLFGEDGLLRFTRDLLIMAVPLLVGALAVVATGLPGDHFEKRPRGADLRLDGRSLTLRQFVCYLLGYLSFVAIVTLMAVVVADLMHASVLEWIKTSAPIVRIVIEAIGTLALSLLLSLLTVTVFWALYFLTEVINRTD